MHGVIPDELIRMNAAVVAAKAAGIAAIRPGVTGEEVHRAVAATIEEHGYSMGLPAANAPPSYCAMTHGTGHGVGLLTMLAEAGSGTLAGNAHQDTFLQIAKSDAVSLAGVLQNAIDVPLLEQHFPGQPVQAYFEFSPNLTQETRQVVQDALLLKAAGLEV